MQLSGQKFVVTGGAGFIGSHVVDALIAQGAAVTVIDDLSTGHSKNLEQSASSIEFIHASLLDLEALSSAFNGASGVFHLAAAASVVESIEDPIRVHQINATGTLQVIEAARRQARAPKIVFSSSAAVYGTEPTLPKRETMAPAACNPYGIQKLLGEQYLRCFHALYAMPSISLRYFNVFGPRQDPSSMYSGVVSAFCDHATRGKQLRINGDGEATRDFVFVADVVQANLKAMLSDVEDGRPINIGTGHSTSILELATSIHATLNRPEAITFGPERHGDIRHSYADICQARRQLGYEPKFDLRAGLRQLLGVS